MHRYRQRHTMPHVTTGTETYDYDRSEGEVLMEQEELLRQGMCRHRASPSPDARQDVTLLRGEVASEPVYRMTKMTFNPLLHYHC